MHNHAGERLCRVGAEAGLAMVVTDPPHGVRLNRSGGKAWSTKTSNSVREFLAVGRLPHRRGRVIQPESGTNFGRAREQLDPPVLFRNHTIETVRAIST